MEAFNQLDLFKLLNSFYRRKELIAAVFLGVFSISVYLVVTLPNLYLSSILILITPQKLPESYIKSTVTMSVAMRIQAIQQDILSRTRLATVINQLNLYPTGDMDITMEDRVVKMRKNIRIETQPRHESFRLSFWSRNPTKAQETAARLGSLFIEENLRIREQRAVGTTVFIKSEAERLKEQLEFLEANVNQFKAKYMNELPAQLDVNLKMQRQAQDELWNKLTRLSTLQDRKVNIQKQLVEWEKTSQDKGEAEGTTVETVLPQLDQTEGRTKQLEALLIRYSERHPDVISLKQEIQALEEIAKTRKQETEVSDFPAEPPAMNGIPRLLLGQIGFIGSEIKVLQSNNEELRSKIALYQTHIDNTPVRGIELSKITRPYSITLRKYQELLAKLLDSKIAENMEKKQKAEQFRVVDPANLPQEPASPKRKLILFVGLIIGLGAGFGLAYVLESIDSSVKSGEELNGYISVPLLATIPAFTTRAAVLEKRRQQVILALMSVGGLAVGIVAIRLYVQYFA